MAQKTSEIMVGLFLLAGFLAFVFLAIRVSGLNPEQLQRETYNLTATFNNVSGLSEGAKVSIAGVTVGRVEVIRLDPISVRARVQLKIDKRIDYITDDSIAAIRTAGILGEKYVAISVGGSPEILEDGGTIRQTQSSLVLEELVGKFLTRAMSNQ